MHDRSYDREPVPARSAPALAKEASDVGQPFEPELLELQRTHGNRFVQRVVAAHADDGEVPAALEQRIDRARGRGVPLEPGVRGRMESAFGVDFGPVRVHTGPEADALNQAVSARAFTTGSDMFFAGNQYAPGSPAGRELLAHELTHVVQQAGAAQTRLRLGAVGDSYEHEADAIARTVGGRDAAGPETSS